MADSETELDGGGRDDLNAAMHPEGGEDFLVEEGTKKSSNQGLLVALLVAALGGGGYYYYSSQGPATASAATSATTNTNVAAKKTINEFLSGGGKDLAAMELMLRNTERVVKQFLAYPSMTQVPLSDLKTNPFRFAPPAEQPQAESDTKRLHEEAKQRAVKAVAGLTIESIMTGRAGSGGTAIINGKFVRPGNEVDGFKIEEIRQGSVIVSGDGFRFELRQAR